MDLLAADAIEDMSKRIAKQEDELQERAFTLKRDRVANKAFLVIDMPNCCDECFALDDNGDYPFCLITHEQQGYNFRTREQRMGKCPLQPILEKEPK